jgi:transposase
VIAYLAQQMAKDPIARLMRVAWDSVGRIVDRVVAERLDGGRLHGLARIGVDEVSYRRRHRYLTVVADHDTGRIVWLAKCRNSATLQAFFDELGGRRATIRAISIDMSGGYEKAIREHTSAEICFDPFHVVRVAADAVDQVRRDEWNAHDRSHTTAGKWVKNTRWALLKAPDRQSLDQLGTLGEVYVRNQRLYRAFLLYHQLRPLYALEDPALAPAHLDAWLGWAARSKLAPFVKAARTLRRHRDGILAAIRLGLSNVAPELTEAVAARVTTGELHEQARRDLGGFVDRTVVENERVYESVVRDDRAVQGPIRVLRARRGAPCGRAGTAHLASIRR